MATELASAYITLIPSLKNAQREIESQLSKVDGAKAGASIGGKLTSGFSGSVKGVASVAASAFATVAKVGVATAGAITTAVAGMALKGGFDRALSIEKAQSKLLGLGHSSESVSAIMDDALASVKGTAFGLGDAATVAAQMSAAGVTSGEQMQRVLKTVADTAQISGRSLTDVGNIFGSVAAKGKLQGDDMLQLMSSGIPVLQMLGTHLGKTSEEVSEMVSKGEIDFQTFSDAMEEGLGGAALQAGATFSGAMANVSAALSRVGEKFMSPVLDSLRVVFNALIPVIDEVSNALTPLADLFATKLASATEWLVNVLTTFSDALATGETAASAFRMTLFEVFDGTKLQFIADALEKPFIDWKDRVGILVDGAGRAILGGIKNIGKSIKSSLIGVFAGTDLGFITVALNSPFLSWKDKVGIIVDGTKNLLVAKTGELKDGALEKLESLKRGFEEKIASLPQPIQTVIGKLQEFGGWIASTFGGANAQATAFAATFGGALALIGPKLAPVVKTVTALMGSMGGFTGMLSGVATGIMGVGSKVAGLGSAFMTAGGGLKGLTAVFGAFMNPVGLVVGIVSALAAGFAYLMVTNEEFRATIMGLVGDIGESLAPILLVVTQSVQRLATELMPVFMSLVNALLPIIGQIVTIIFQIAAALAPVITMIVSTVLPIITEIIAVVAQVVAMVAEAVLPVVSQVLAKVQEAMPTIQAIIETVMYIILGVVETVWPAMQMAIETAMNAIQSIIDIVMAAINGDWEGVWNGIQSLFSGIWSGICGLADYWAGVLKNAIHGAVTWISDQWNSAWNGIKDFFGNLWNDLCTSANNGINDLYTYIREIPSKVTAFFSGARDWLRNAGLNILNGLLDGLKAAWGEVTSFVGGIGDWIVSHKGPPSYDARMLTPAGKLIMGSLATGLEKGMPELERTMKNVTSTVAGWEAPDFSKSIENSIGDALDVAERFQPEIVFKARMEDIPTPSEIGDFGIGGSEAKGIYNTFGDINVSVDGGDPDEIIASVFDQIEDARNAYSR